MEDVEITKEDKLIVKGLEFHSFHGVMPEERKFGQKFLMDVDAWMDLRTAVETDLLVDTIGYTEIYSIVKEGLEGPPNNLLEFIADLIASTILTKLLQISVVRVKVRKLHVAVHGSIDYLGVEILGQRDEHLYCIFNV